MAGKYRIDSIEINEFKAFTNQQRVPIKGKTTFIFGNNGLGKSSIVEAIVWCLYGTESNVRNQFYHGSCVVSLYLSQSDDASKIWRITRRMH
ncbi:MAG: AAA family ATPase [Nitrososphaerales archaeon]